MPIGSRATQDDSNPIQDVVQSVLGFIDGIFSSETTLEEFVKKSTAELNNKILQEQESGNTYVAGRLQLQCESDTNFTYAFSMYFQTPRDEWIEIKGQSKSLPLNSFTAAAQTELMGKRELVYEIDAPIADSNKSGTIAPMLNNQDTSEGTQENIGQKIEEEDMPEPSIEENMINIQQELETCKEYAKEGLKAVQESYDNLKSALSEERQKLQDANRQQNQWWRLKDEKQFNKQLKEMENTEWEIKEQVGANIRDLKKRQEAFTIVLYGRTMAGKSTLMEILTHGNGASIGKGSQRTTLDVRAYTWNGLKIYDVPGIGSFGGNVDDRVALEAAKSADMALFLITDDAPQPIEAERLAELKSLGKPILGIVNVKQTLTPDSKSAKRKVDIKKLSNKMSDNSRLEEIVKQFKEFAKKSNQDFSDIEFVSAHLQAAYYSQPERENDDKLYRLSNFSAVEQFILDKVRQDGGFMCYKNYMNSAALPMQHAVAMLYKHSSESWTAYFAYNEKIENLDKWREKFLSGAQKKYDDFMSNLRSQLNAEINYVVNNFYDSEYAGERWKERVDSLNVNHQCQIFINRIGEDATKKMRSLSDELTQDLRYSSTSFDIPKISMDDITDWQGGMMIAAPLLAFTPVGWVGAAIFGIGSWLFGDSKEEKIRKAKQELRGKLEESRDEILGNIGDKVLEIVNDEIFHNQIDGFFDTLYDMKEMIARLAYEQNSVADTINEQYRDLNYDLFWEAINYLDIAQPEKVYTSRIVGQELFVFTNSKLMDDQKRALSKLLNEKISLYVVNENDQEYWKDARTAIENNIPGSELSIVTMEREWGDMNVIFISREDDISDEYLQIIQQHFGSPLVRD